MNITLRMTLILASAVTLSGCVSQMKTVTSEGHPNRCANIFSEQTIAVSDLNDNAIAYLFGKDKRPEEFRKSVSDVKMIAYGSPIASSKNKCQRWMQVKGLNETRSWDLDGWNFMSTTWTDN